MVVDNLQTIDTYILIIENILNNLDGWQYRTCKDKPLRKRIENLRYIKETPSSLSIDLKLNVNFDSYNEKTDSEKKTFQTKLIKIFATILK